jgi:hypothetical protein
MAEAAVISVRQRRQLHVAQLVGRALELEADAARRRLRVRDAVLRTPLIVTSMQPRRPARRMLFHSPGGRSLSGAECALMRG